MLKPLCTMNMQPDWAKDEEEGDDDLMLEEEVEDDLDTAPPPEPRAQNINAGGGRNRHGRRREPVEPFAEEEIRAGETEGTEARGDTRAGATLPGQQAAMGPTPEANTAGTTEGTRNEAGVSGGTGRPRKRRALAGARRGQQGRDLIETIY